ncbi:MAG: hypothetical protein HY747_00795 [Elusimicrobia bacterium]|nr:hypothetical protein [Elusimicrobiota bacterium]
MLFTAGAMFSHEEVRKAPELWDQNPVPREILIGEYRLIYRVTGRAVEIVALVHGRRILPH